MRRKGVVSVSNLRLFARCHMAYQLRQARQATSETGRGRLPRVNFGRLRFWWRTTGLANKAAQFFGLLAVLGIVMSYFLGGPQGRPGLTALLLSVLMACL